MHHLRLDELVPEDAIAYSVVHPCCQVLLPFGADLTSIHLRLLRQAGVKSVYLLDKYDSILRLLAHAKNQVVATTELLPDDVVGFPIADRQGKLVVGLDTPIDQSLIERLVALGHDRLTVRRRGGVDEPSYRRFKQAIAPIEPLYELHPAGLDGIERIPCGELAAAPFCSRPWPEPGSDGRPPLLDQVDRQPQTSRGELRKEAYIDLYSRAVEQTLGLHYRLIHEPHHLDAMSLYPLLSRLINAYLIDRPLLLALAGEQRDVDFLCSETVKVTILAINVAVTLGYSFPAVLEIAYGAYLHDIGMLQVPRRVREKQGPLTSKQAELLRRHTVAGLELLGKIERLPVSTPIVVYQSHERLDGTGYPGGAAGADLHPFAQIVGAADVYQAISSTRPHRPASHPGAALAEVGRLAEAGQISSGVYRSLLGSLSHHPVGSWVRLADGRTARVVAAGDDPRCPRLELLDDALPSADLAGPFESADEPTLELPALACF